MNMDSLPLNFNEKVTFKLRSLYEKYGYSQYRMGKFEEYDLYAKNKDFLVSDRVIAFTDTNGKLMALKPDVTLSIIKNIKDQPDKVRKLFYNENVYRVSKGTGSFREIMQTGLECFGSIDDYCMSEVMMLAAKSLVSISEKSVLAVSHLGFLSDLIDSIGIDSENKAAVLGYIGNKNPHDLAKLCESIGIDEKSTAMLRRISEISGEPAKVIPEIISLCGEITDTSPLYQLLSIIKAASDSETEKVFVFDFSVVDDVNYYNGIIFKGFVEGVPTSVLSGGRYDNLMKKMNHRSGAIGFAVYTDVLELLYDPQEQYDADVLLLYDEKTDIATVGENVRKLIDGGFSVAAHRSIPDNFKYKFISKLTDGKVNEIENNA